MFICISAMMRANEEWFESLSKLVSTFFFKCYTSFCTVYVLGFPNEKSTSICIYNRWPSTRLYSRPRIWRRHRGNLPSCLPDWPQCPVNETVVFGQFGRALFHLQVTSNWRYGELMLFSDDEMTPCHILLSPTRSRPDSHRPRKPPRKLRAFPLFYSITCVTSLM